MRRKGPRQQHICCAVQRVRKRGAGWHGQQRERARTERVDCGDRDCPQRRPKARGMYNRAGMCKHHGLTYVDGCGGGEIGRFDGTVERLADLHRSALQQQILRRELLDPE